MRRRQPKRRVVQVKVCLPAKTRGGSAAKSASLPLSRLSKSFENNSLFPALTRTFGALYLNGSNSIKIILDGEGEMQKIEISDEILRENKTIIEDLIVAAHNNAKIQLKSKTSEEISKTTGGVGIPGFKWPL